jgi:hypothetical protein
MAEDEKEKKQGQEENKGKAEFWEKLGLSSVGPAFAVLGVVVGVLLTNYLNNSRLATEREHQIEIEFRELSRVKLEELYTLVSDYHYTIRSMNWDMLTRRLIYSAENLNSPSNLQVNREAEFLKDMYLTKRDFAQMEMLILMYAPGIFPEFTQLNVQHERWIDFILALDSDSRLGERDYLDALIEEGKLQVQSMSRTASDLCFEIVEISHSRMERVPLSEQEVRQLKAFIENQEKVDLNPSVKHEFMGPISTTDVSSSP